MDDWLKLLLASVDLAQLRILALLCLANMGTGVLAAVVKGTLNLLYVKEMWKRIGTLFGAYVLTAFFTVGLANFAPVLTAVWVGLLADLTARLLLNLKDIGLPVPESLAKIAGRVP